jgi:signal transduction histidine kinase
MSQGGKLLIQAQIQGKAVRIIMRDNGKGIAAEDLPRIFEAYFTTKDHGSGLGLLFVYDVITDHGGKIQVESKINQGTTFEILLPLRRTNLQIDHTLNQRIKDSGHV